MVNTNNETCCFWGRGSINEGVFEKGDNPCSKGWYVLAILVGLAVMGTLAALGFTRYSGLLYPSWRFWSITIGGGIIGAALIVLGLYKLHTFKKSSSFTTLIIQPETAPIQKTDSARPQTENKQPFLLPKYVTAKNGAIANAHLWYYLDQHVKNQKQMDEIILWSFTQRKFQSLGTVRDTTSWPKNGKAFAYFINQVFGSLFIDAEGHALSTSGHSTHLTYFIEDEEILEIIPCTRYKLERPSETPLWIGITEEGKHVIHQPGVRSCVFTSAAMVLTDYGVKVDYSSLYSTNLEDDDSLRRFLTEYGYALDKKACLSLNRLATPSLMQNPEQLKEYTSGIQDLLNIHHSLLVGVDGSVGGHEIVVNRIDEQSVTIREPAHGWCIKIKIETFLEMQPECKIVKKRDN